MVAAAVGGSILGLSILLFVIVATGTYFRKPSFQAAPANFFMTEEEPNATPVPPILDNLRLWSALALLLALLAYAGPIAQHFASGPFLAPGMRTW